MWGSRFVRVAAPPTPSLLPAPQREVRAHTARRTPPSRQPRPVVTGQRVANGLPFACYHVHEPWVIPPTFLVDTFAEALPSRRWRSALIGIVVHSRAASQLPPAELGLERH